jgi:hypothetical protein
MRLDHLPSEVHLTYCTNVHAGESWDQVRDSLESHLPPIKAAVSPDAPLGLGQRLAAIAAQALRQPAAFDELRGAEVGRDLDNHLRAVVANSVAGRDWKPYYLFATRHPPLMARTPHSSPRRRVR